MGCFECEKCDCPASLGNTASVNDVYSFGATPAGGVRVFLNGVMLPSEPDDVPRTLADQVGALMPYIGEALQHVLCDESAGVSRERELLQLVGERIVTGHAEHGANLFTMSDADLAQNLAEELADAVVYRAEMLRRKAGAH